MSMLEIKNEKLSEALKKIRVLYPDDSLGDAIIMAVGRIKKAEKACEELNRTALEAGARAYEFDKRYCDILVEKRQLERENKQFKTIAENLENENEHLAKLINDQVRWINELKTMLNNIYGEGYIPDYTYPAREIRRVRLEELEK